MMPWRRHRPRPGPILPDYRPPADSHVTGGTAVLPTTSRPEVLSRPRAGITDYADPMMPESIGVQDSRQLDPLPTAPWARPSDYAVRQSHYAESGLPWPPLDGRHSVVMAAPYTWALPRPAEALAPPQWAPAAGDTARAEQTPTGVPGDLYAVMRPWDASPIITGGGVPSGSGNQLGAGGKSTSGGGDCA